MSEENFAPYYSKIAQVLGQMIPVKWTELFMIYYGEDGVSSIGMYFRAKDGTLHWCNDIPSNFCVDEEFYDNIRKELQDICEAYKKVFVDETGDSWSCMSFYLTVDMGFDIKYYYDMESDVTPNRIMDRIFYETYKIEPEGDFDRKLLYEYLEGKKSRK